MVFMQFYSGNSFYNKLKNCVHGKYWLCKADFKQKIPLLTHNNTFLRNKLNYKQRIADLNINRMFMQYW